MFNTTISRVIIEIPWLHNLIGTMFILSIFLFIGGFMYILYKLVRLKRAEKVVWMFEGKTWDYWKNKK